MLSKKMKFIVKPELIKTKKLLKFSGILSQNSGKALKPERYVNFVSIYVEIQPN